MQENIKITFNCTINIGADIKLWPMWWIDFGEHDHEARIDMWLSEPSCIILLFVAGWLFTRAIPYTFKEISNCNSKRGNLHNYRRFQEGSPVIPSNEVKQ